MEWGAGGGMPSGGRQLVGVGAVSCDGGTGAHADMVVHACSVKTTRPSHVAWSSASRRVSRSSGRTGGANRHSLMRK